MTRFRDSALLRGTINGATYLREDRSMPDVEVPPAFLITDQHGGMWSLGTEYEVIDRAYQFNVIRNDVDVGETAAKIVFRRGIVWIYGRPYGRKQWTGRTFI